MSDLRQTSQITSELRLSYSVLILAVVRSSIRVEGCEFVCLPKSFEYMYLALWTELSLRSWRGCGSAGACRQQLERLGMSIWISLGRTLR